MCKNNKNNTTSAKQWKRVPFDLELAKKINSGEVEGRIVARDGSEARILAFDIKGHIYPILTAILSGEREYFYLYNNDGKFISDKETHYDLFIELPEETPKQYPYDRVKDKISDADWKEAKKTFPDSHNMQSAFISGIAYQVCKEIDCKKSMEHEFKPFDRVLVRKPELIDPHDIYEPDKWVPTLFQGVSDDGCCFIAEHQEWNECIPYEGNEHLVYTTNNPE